MARDQNPLTKLPGNNSIGDHISASLEAQHPGRHTFVYFDFNDFKPFNDHYGFRQGDRAILLFAEIMQRNLPGTFIGHIGGDDFFAAFEGKSLIDVQAIVATILRRREQVAMAHFKRSANQTLEYIKQKYGAADPRVLTLRSIIGSCEIAEAVMQLVMTSVERALGDSQSLLSRALTTALKLSTALPGVGKKRGGEAADTPELADSISRYIEQERAAREGRADETTTDPVDAGTNEEERFQNHG